MKNSLSSVLFHIRSIYLTHIIKGVILMKKNIIKYSLNILLIASILTFTVVGCSSNDNANKINGETNEVSEISTENLTAEDFELTLEGYGAKGALSDKDLSIADMLMYAAQDEYLARAEYAAIIEKFDVTRPYSNIMKSEETHLDYLEDIYAKYKMEFPLDEAKEKLVIPNDLLEAAKVGVQAEIDNIAMYEKFLSYDLSEDIENVFNSLMKGSVNHLNAFQNQVEKLS
jgi:hypothetical protein